MKTAKQYRIPIVPSYFSNISTIARLAVLHDAPISTELEQKRIALHAHFNDLYQVFLHRLSQFTLADTISAAEVEKLGVYSLS